jgi:hypothetical protein
LLFGMGVDEVADARSVKQSSAFGVAGLSD